MRFRLLAFVLLAGVAPVHAAPPIENLVRAIESNATAEVFAFVEDYYRDAGISVNDTLSWRAQPFNEIVNWYNPWSEEIVVSALPSASETADYWDNWSRVLTDGRWNWRSFFSDEAEAYRMAGFNQFLLAAHEFGHALTYRFDEKHESRGDNEINCREYPADRLAAGFLQEVANKDERLAHYKARYRELIAAINAEIDPQYRYDVPSFEALNADCRIFHVEQPTDETLMTPYASAFFARQGVLQATDLPSLQQMYDTYLLPYWRETQQPDAGRAGPVTTLGPLPDPPPVRADGELKYDRHSTLAADGTLYAIEIGKADDTYPLRMSFSYGPAGAPLETVVPDQRLPLFMGPYDGFGILSALSLGPDQYLVATFDFAGDNIWLFSASRAEPHWHFAARKVGRKESFTTQLARDAAGGVYLFVEERKDQESYDLATRRVKVDPQTLELTEVADGTVYASLPRALLADGTPVMVDDNAFLVPDGAGGMRTYAFAGLQGFKDSDDPLAAEFANLSPSILPDPDGGLRFLDYDPKNKRLVLRRIAPRQ